MPPRVTMQAALYADSAIECSFNRAVEACTTRDDARRELLRLQAKLTVKHGGFQLANHYAGRDAAHVASVAATWASVCTAFPHAASLDITTTDSTNDVAVAFAGAYESVRATDEANRRRCALMAEYVYFDVYGKKHTAYHPALPSKTAMPPLPTLHIDPDSKIHACLRTKALSTVGQMQQWFQWVDACGSFDALNRDAVSARREARRGISVSQVGAGQWLQQYSDFNIRGSRMPSPGYRAALQYRSGLEISQLQPLYDAMEARGAHVTQADRLGDTAVNAKGTTTARHNRLNRAVKDMLAAVEDGPVWMGDKGDGSPKARADALLTWAHYNSSHVPDIIVPGDVDRLYELKCWSPFCKHDAKGLGTDKGGAKPSTAVGDRLAFGCTLEAALYMSVGCKERGDPSEPAMKHDTGVGWVAARDGHYAPAIAAKRRVTVLVAEVTGAMSDSIVATIAHCDDMANAAGGSDRTGYGTSRTATTSFFTHHLRALSCAVAWGVGAAVSRVATVRKGELARPLSEWMPQSYMVEAGTDGTAGGDVDVRAAAA
jgi:hypothetical protein